MYLVQWFKTMTSNEYIRGVKQQGWPRFNKRLWQRNYWDHIIRNEEDYIIFPLHKKQPHFLDR
ncbi:transposase [sulfur-oxidizing endosymbiont of Gigantopelta aegis]|uniref:transposase n=1 Tax=sulfur-oxidizing endosymbiont of Gigantopelta aegis TaxID=2794934 RepID=UPI0018DCEB2B|nr:transposase [sulfur-oxidizing endosymbiont of Gigantopelta aegis]